MSMQTQCARRVLPLLVLALGASSARAQVEEIIVTAQKREQNIQETPIAISALDAGVIENRDIREVTALNNMVPNLRLLSTPGNQNGTTIAIRGSVTYNPALTYEPTVGLYLDGIYLGKSLGSAFDIADLERIEVLRGPQGTLYGKNTIAGAVSLVTRQPSGEFGAKLKLGTGNYNLRSGRLDLDLPALGAIGEGAGRLSTKLSLARKTRDGFVKNETVQGLPGANLGSLGGGNGVPARPAASDTLGNINSTSGRLVALWQPRQDLDITYAYDFSDSEQTPQYYQLTEVGPYYGAVIAPGAARFASKHRQDRASLDWARRDDSHVKGHALTVAWDLGDMGALGDVTLKSLTGHRRMNSYQTPEFDGTPYLLGASIGDYRYRALSQEFQWIGSADHVEYVAGLYYLKEKGDVVNPSYQRQFGSDHADAWYGMNDKSMAAFGQLEWVPPVLDNRLTLTVGGRFNKERKTAYRTQINYPLAAPGTALVVVPPGTSAAKDFQNFSPMAVAAFQVDDNINVYARVARGWKGGGFNSTAASVAGFKTPFGEETVTAYELGLKSQWLDNRLRANFAGFYDRHRDAQISQYVPGASPQSLTTNAGRSTVKGLELELVAAPVDNLELSASYGWLHAKFDRYQDTCQASARVNCPAGVVPGQVYDAAGLYAVPYAPKGTAALAATYTLPLPVGELVSRVDWSYVSDYVLYPQPSLARSTAVRRYDLVDLRFTWQHIPIGSGGDLALSLWSKNLLDKSYLANGIDFGTPNYYAVNRFGDPRTFGFDATVKF